MSSSFWSKSLFIDASELTLTSFSSCFNGEDAFGTIKLPKSRELIISGKIYSSMCYILNFFSDSSSL